MAEEMAISPPGWVGAEQAARGVGTGAWLLTAVHLRQAQPPPPILGFSLCNMGVEALPHLILYSGSTWGLEEQV